MKRALLQLLVLKTCHEQDDLALDHTYSLGSPTWSTVLLAKPCNIWWLPPTTNTVSKVTASCNQDDGAKTLHVVRIRKSMLSVFHHL